MLAFRPRFNSFRREIPHTLEGTRRALHHGESRGFLKASRAHPSAARHRSRFGAISFHQRDQFVAVMFELLVADAGDAAELR